MKNISIIATTLLLGSSLFASDASLQAQIDELKKEIQELRSSQIVPTPAKLDEVIAEQKSIKADLAKVQKSNAMDKVKFSIDFRNAVDAISYKDRQSGYKLKNNSLLTSRFILGMQSSPQAGKLAFKGKLAVYSKWGGDLVANDGVQKDWSASSKASDTIMRIKEAIFIYNDKLGEQPFTLSVGRRPATTGFLANLREYESEGSPLAHITNMEVNGAMLKLDWDRFISGSYSKFVVGRAHTGDVSNVYGTPRTLNGKINMPYAYTKAKEDHNVDWFVFLGDAYNDKKHQLMYEWAHIFNTKGKNLNKAGDDAIRVDAGSADLFALSYKLDGLSSNKESFLGKSLAFASVASTHYKAKSGYELNGSGDGGSSNGYSFWVGANVPDLITDSGVLGFEYNHGSKYFTPMTWAEDSAIGSKVALRGDAYEAYWNFDLFGMKNLPSQVRYTYVKHNYTPNLNCAGWQSVEEVDIIAQNLRFFITYRY